MKKYILFLLAAAAATAVSCSKSEITDTTPQEAPYTIHVSLGNGTRTELADDNGAIKQTWKADDKIYVIAHATGEGNAYEFSTSADDISADGKTAKFTSTTFPTGATPTYAVHRAGNTPFATINPTSLPASTSTSFKSSPAELLSAQMKMMPLVAKYDATTKNFVFQCVVSILRFDLTLPNDAQGEVHSLCLATVDLSLLSSGVFKFDITGDTPVCTQNMLSDRTHLSAGSNSYILPANKKVIAYLPSAPTEALNGVALKLNVVVGTKVYSTTLTGGQLEISKCHSIIKDSNSWQTKSFAESGTGKTAATAYILTSEEHLRTLEKAMNNSFSTYEKYFQLGNDITVAPTTPDTPWIPIGTRRPFSGSFNGAGKTIRGSFKHFQQDNNSRNNNYVGLFGKVSQGGEIANLTVDGDIISSGHTKITYGGGVVADAAEHSVKITNCRHKGNVSVTSNSSVSVGGVVGMLRGAGDFITQEGGIVSGTTDNNNNAIVGGAVGSLDLDLDFNPAALHRSYSTANVEAVGNAASTAGAVVGSANSEKTYSCSAFDASVVVTLNSTTQTPIPALGSGPLASCDANPVHATRTSVDDIYQ